MLFELADWVMQVDVEMTRAHTRANAADHCGCAYCKNYYEMLPATYPGLCVALNRMGIDPMGPSELMPFTPTVYLACYRVCGTIEKWGTSALAAEGVPVAPERAEEEGSFFLWVGEAELPWCQPENPRAVISPANLPEFMERMGEMWRLLHEQENICS